MKNFFNIGLVEVKSHIVSKKQFVTTFSYHRSVLSPSSTKIETLLKTTQGDKRYPREILNYLGLFQR
jgi:hypothetical protein